MSRIEDWTDPEDEVTREPSPFHLTEYLELLRQRRRFIVWSTLIGTVLALGVSLLMRDNYTSVTVIMPPKQEASAGTLLAGAGGAGSLLSGGGLSAVGMSLKNPNEVYVSLLQSRTLNERLIQQFNLKAYYHQSTTSQAVKTLLKHTTTEIGKDGLITLAVTTHNPQLSADIANAYIDQLHTMNTNLALTDSAQRRVFYEEEIDDQKKKLAAAEESLAQTQIKTGVLQPVGQADILTRNISTLQAQITQREAALQSLATFYTPENPQYKQAQAEISSLRARLSALQSSQAAPAPGDVNVPTARLPQASVEYLRRYRDLQLNEQVYAVLEKQYEAAKIDEAKTAPIIQVVDRAIPADRPSGPYRWLITLGGGVLVLLLNGFWSAGSYAIRALQRSRTVTS